ncbi:TPA: hypothetical protein DDZ10_03100 [Candidatus Uhrbacteria bacterium]|nr:MAG: hypothetical protein UY79_C0001G0051 [Parcubacteria group bacterium GW2011_GWA2_53_21]OGL72083.1 MAG: hypothetical protein A3D69_01450 [Candidatus Uhrbacteria bacterium RIFCSPHIGHO2_02_FULL_54_11]HBL39636.1 hypothetical protein [Candidatus Uhrbacteria bacterium]
MFEHSLLELLRALPDFLAPRGPYANLAWRDPAAWLEYVFCVLAWLALPTALFGGALALLRRRGRALGARSIGRAAWTLLALELGLGLLLWVVGYWLLALPVAILVLILWWFS